MSLLLQHLAVLATVATSGGYLLRATWRSLHGKPAGLGSCCAQGCRAKDPGPPAPQFVPAGDLAARALAARRLRQARP